MTNLRLVLLIPLLSTLIALGGCASSAPKMRPVDTDTKTPPPANREFRAAWVATVGNIDWPTKKGLTAQEQQQEAIAILDKSVDLNLNAIVLQVRTSADALYKSDIEPWSEFLTGEQGKDPGYDPLQFWIDESHKRGLELHAWFNPYRAMYGGGDKAKRSKDHIWNTNRAIVKEYGNMLWMDPGEKAAQDITVDVFMDVVKRYDVDGIHVDDYFYPYRVSDENQNPVDFPDAESWKKYQESGGQLSRGDWRRDNINRTMKEVYERSHRLKPWVKFGISPFGLPRPNEIGTVQGFDQYEELYADAKLWLNKGWLDYWTPQLYWKPSEPQLNYMDLLHYWIDENTQGRHVWPGIYTTRIKDGGSRQFETYDLLNQVWLTQQTPGASGHVHFSMKGLMRDRHGISSALIDGPYRDEALVPASPWLDDKAPPKPNRVRSGPVDDTGKPSTQPILSTGRYPAGDEPATYPSTRAATQPTRKKLWTGRSVTWEAAKGEEAWLYAVYSKHGTRWDMKVVPGSELSTIVYDDAALGAISAVYVSSVDRCGNESGRVKASYREE